MSVTQMAISRLYREAEALCHRRNANTSVDLGKCYFELLDNGVEFHKAHYLLDSQHSEYTVAIARVIYHASDALWWLYIPSEDATWQAYPPMPNSSNLAHLLTEIERDPANYFW